MGRHSIVALPRRQPPCVAGYESATSQDIPPGPIQPFLMADLNFVKRPIGRGNGLGDEVKINEALGCLASQDFAVGMLRGNVRSVRRAVAG
jgi:hypothetical protein